MTLNKKTRLAAAIDERKKKAEYRNSLRSLITELLVVILILTAIFSFVFGITVQHGNDMYPAVKDGDIILYYRTSKLLNTEAVVYDVEGKTYVGRVAAGPGSQISMTGDMQVTVDGILMPIDTANGIYTKTYADETAKYPLTLEDDAYFVLGDNRDEAKDSRQFGQIHKRNIDGRVITVIRRRQI